MLRAAVESIGGPDATAKELKAAIQTVAAELVDMWHERMAPQHFTNTAAGRYGYQARSKVYLMRKARRFHHQRPLEFSGRMRAEVLRKVKAAPTRYGAKAVMNGPKYLYQYRKDLKQPDKAAELTATSEDERRILGKLLTDGVSKRLNAVRVRETRRID